MSLTHNLAVIFPHFVVTASALFNLITTDVANLQHTKYGTASKYIIKTGHMMGRDSHINQTNQAYYCMRQRHKDSINSELHLYIIYSTHYSAY